MRWARWCSKASAWNLGDDISLLNRADELGRQLSSAVETVQLVGVVMQSRRELEQLFASIAHLIVVVDRRGIIVRVNQAFADVLGREADAAPAAAAWRLRRTRADGMAGGAGAPARRARRDRA